MSKKTNKIESNKYIVIKKKSVIINTKYKEGPWTDKIMA